MAAPEPEKPEAPARKPTKSKLDDEEDGTASTPQLRQKMLPTGLSRAIVIAAFIWGAVMLVNGLLPNRYDLIPAPNTQNSFMYRLDRLTGRVHFCGAQQCVEVPMKPAPQE
ncbi:MAG: hypothetical protein EPO08_12020 [Rhodospirillaceae bacterium]|nr:MAG: hypothetical protein EPO08_12020 [Rhodospirillaceae bacterium]